MTLSLSSFPPEAISFPDGEDCPMWWPLAPKTVTLSNITEAYSRRLGPFEEQEHLFASLDPNQKFWRKVEISHWGVSSFFALVYDPDSELAEWAEFARD